MANASGQSLPPLEKRRQKSKTKSKTSDVSSSPSHQQMRTSKKDEQKGLPVDDSGSDGNRPDANKSNCTSGVKSSVGPLFLSVETLLRRDKPMESHPLEQLEEEEVEEEEDEDEEMRQPELGEEGDEEEEAHWRRRTLRHPAHHFQPGRGGREAAGTTAGSHRNYKNMTRERRMQANARERTRVHTISSAFEALRRAVPSFSHGQRLSKLSILRVASAYIAALGQLAGDDNDQDDRCQHRGTTNANGRCQLSECVDRCTRTLMTEGQLLRRNRKRSGVAGRPRNATDDEDDADD